MEQRIRIKMGVLSDEQCTDKGKHVERHGRKVTDLRYSVLGWPDCLEY